jgi:hypothetical protein
MFYSYMELIHDSVGKALKAANQGHLSSSLDLGLTCTVLPTWNNLLDTNVKQSG